MKADSDFRQLQLQQVDAALARWRNAALPAAPSSGWIRAIREALGMTATALAKRLNMSGAGLGKIERSEAQGRVTLATLRKVADALDCDLRYALVPRQPLDDKLMDQARRVVAEQMRPVSHSMALENQGVDSKEAVDKWMEAAARSLIHRSPRDLW